MSNPKPTERPVFNIDEDPQNANWLYTWGNLPTNLQDLRAWLHARGIAVEAFKHSGRYQANVGRMEWLKDL